MSSNMRDCYAYGTILKKGNQISKFIKLPVEEGIICTPTTVAAITIDPSCLCNTKIKLDFILNVDKPEGIPSINVGFQAFRTCSNEFQKIPIGSQQYYVITGSNKSIYTFSVYDYEMVENKSCIYTVEATVFA